MKKYLIMIGFMLLYSVIYIGLLVGLQPLFFIVLGKLPIIGKFILVPLADGMTKPNVPLFHIFSDAIILPFFILVYALLKRENLFMSVRFNYKNLTYINIIVIVVMAFFASLFTAAFMKLPWAKDILPGMHMLLNTRLLDQNIIQFIFWLPLHCAVFREILMRGMVYNEFKKVMPMPMAQIMQGLMQGLYFFQFGKLDCVLYGLLSCVFFGLIYEWTDSLFASCIAQVTIETFLLIWKSSGYVFFTDKTSGLILGVCIIVISGAMLYLREYELNRRGKKSQI